MQPKVTVITPCHRPRDLQRVMEVFISQTYSNKEMLVLMDDEHYNLSDVHNHIFVWGLADADIAVKRNHLCSHATGEIIFHFDSDDWFAPDWIAHTVAHMQQTGADTTGLDVAWFYKAHTDLWQYRWNGKMVYVIGGTLAYKRRIWQNNPFKSTKAGYGEDTLFLGKAGRIIPHNFNDGFVAMIHDQNTTSHNGVLTNPRFSRHAPDHMRKVLGADYNKYPLTK